MNPKRFERCKEQLSTEDLQFLSEYETLCRKHKKELYACGCCPTQIHKINSNTIVELVFDSMFGFLHEEITLNHKKESKP